MFCNAMGNPPVACSDINLDASINARNTAQFAAVVGECENELSSEQLSRSSKPATT